MMKSAAVNCVVVGLVLAVVAGPVSAGVTVSVLDGASFPTAADFQTFNPFNPATPTVAERTVREDPAVTTMPASFNGTRHITQTFQLGTELTIDTIDFMFVRGNSGNTGILRMFPVTNTRGDDFTTNFNNAVTNGFLLDVQLTMPAGLDPLSNTEQTLRLSLTDDDRITLPATTGTAGYALSLSSVVDGNTAVNNEVFTWRMGEGPDGANNTERLNNSWYVPGRVLYDDMSGANNTERRRDGLFALQGTTQTLTLFVDPDSGQAELRNVTTEPITFNGYRITSPGPEGSLNPSGWDPIAIGPPVEGFLQGDGSGNGWEVSVELSPGDTNGDGNVDVADYAILQKLGASLSAWHANFGATGSPGGSANELVEWYLTGNSTLAPGGAIGLGQIFSIGETPNLALEFSTASGVRPGDVQYGEIGNGAASSAVPEPATIAVVPIVFSGLLLTRPAATNCLFGA
jgi:hypothetical protein